jgi:hypothetical protein
MGDSCLTRVNWCKNEFQQHLLPSLESIARSYETTGRENCGEITALLMAHAGSDGAETGYKRSSMHAAMNPRGLSHQSDHQNRERQPHDATGPTWNPSNSTFVPQTIEHATRTRLTSRGQLHLVQGAIVYEVQYIMVTSSKSTISLGQVWCVLKVLYCAMYLDQCNCVGQAPRPMKTTKQQQQQQHCLAMSIPMLTDEILHLASGHSIRYCHALTTGPPLPERKQAVTVSIARASIDLLRPLY